jgi:hypothetical protein
MTEKCQDMEYDPTYLVMHHFVGPWKCGTVCLCDAPRHDDKQCMLCMDTMRPTDEKIY